MQTSLQNLLCRGQHPSFVPFPIQSTNLIGQCSLQPTVNRPSQKKSGKKTRRALLPLPTIYGPEDEVDESIRCQRKVSRRESGQARHFSFEHPLVAERD